MRGALQRIRKKGLGTGFLFKALEQRGPFLIFSITPAPAPTPMPPLPVYIPIYTDTYTGHQGGRHGRPYGTPHCVLIHKSRALAPPNSAREIPSPYKWQPSPKPLKETTKKTRKEKSRPHLSPTTPPTPPHSAMTKIQCMRGRGSCSSAAVHDSDGEMVAPRSPGIVTSQDVITAVWHTHH